MAEKGNTKQEILEAVLDLFSAQGYEATSMQQIDDLKHGMNFRVIDAKTEMFSRQGRVYKTPAAILSAEEFILEYPGSTDFFSWIPNVSPRSNGKHIHRH